MITHALTVDVEEYFQVESLAGVIDRSEWPYLESRVVGSTARVLDLFARAGVSATFFTLGWVARREPELVRRIVSAGHELASHGDAHRMITRMSRREFREDIRAAKSALEDAGGVQVWGYRAPTFSVVESTRWALDELLEAGYRYDASIYPIRHDRYGIPTAPRRPHRIAHGASAGLVEFPGTTTRIFGTNLPAGGGGYLRLLPFAYSRWALDRAAREGPFCVYFHPWELDPGQPRFPLPTLAGARTYAGLAGMEARIEKLLVRYAFAPARDVLIRLGLLGPVAAVRTMPVSEGVST